MRYIILSAILMIWLSACTKQTHKNATISRNCTGTYLIIEGKYYFVCNHNSIANYTDSTAIEVSYAVLGHDKVQNCDYIAVCKMLFPYENTITINKIY